MRELDGVRATQDPGADEARGGLDARLASDAREGGDVTKLDAVTENGGGVGECGRARAEPREPKRDGARNGHGAGRALASVYERGLRFFIECFARQRGHARRPKRSRPQDNGERVGENFRQEIRLAALLRRTRREGDQQRETLEPTGEVSHPAQGGRVDPVQIVYRDERGATKSDVGRKPVEALQHRERRIAPRRLLRLEASFTE